MLEFTPTIRIYRYMRMDRAASLGGRPMNIRTIKVRVRILVEPDSEGFYAHCPELTGLHVDGKTEEEAIRNARDAAMAYLTSLIKHNDPCPSALASFAFLFRQPYSDSSRFVS